MKDETVLLVSNLNIGLSPSSQTILLVKNVHFSLKKVKRWL